MGAHAQITVVLLSLWEGDEVSGVAWASRGSRLSGGIIGEAKLREEEAKEELRVKFGAHGALGLGTFSEDEAEEYVDIEDSEEEGGSIEGEVVDVQRKARARPTGTPFDLLPILVADVVITRQNRFLCERNIKKMEVQSREYE
ncbi:hypothetical protein C8J57DRAFT_1236264 [Mycena rebaudengoi]|nr:hypothetical protein C8J57DRAFT_1236264 [Mycena rebaudengoi]